jgi:(S)-mandelate dehydrogenase
MHAVHTLGDLRDRARRNLPRFVFDFVDGGAGAEVSLRSNEQALREVQLTPRVLTASPAADLTTEIVGQRFAAPFGIAPMGLGDLVAPGAEAALARAARHANIPYVLSTAASVPLESIAAIAAENLWFQLYVCRDMTITRDLMRRAKAAGVDVLMITVDGTVPGRRLRDLRNGMSLPLRIRMAMALQACRHPLWSARRLRAGMPRLGNFAPYVEERSGLSEAAAFLAAQQHPHLDWAILERIRAEWRGQLLVKGIMHPEDASRAAALGIDAIVVSNHGGRQLSAAPASITVLPAIRAAVGPSFTILLDGGVRSGEDVVKALACGADFALLGRPFLFSVAALGLEAGPVRTIEILVGEMADTLAQIGCSGAHALGATFLADQNRYLSAKPTMRGSP